MAEAARIYWLHALSSLHVGAGRGDGYIDLPLLREKVTNWPIVPGSSTKGVFADVWRATEDARNDEGGKVLRAAFGRASTSDSNDDHSNAGALLFSDARIVCLAVRSLYGTFAWCTSPLVLQRFSRDLKAAGSTGWPADPSSIESAHVPAKPDVPAESDSHLIAGTKLYLEDLDIDATPCTTAGAWAKQLGEQVFEDDAWQNEFRRRFVVLPDDLFSYLANTATEVQAHVRIDPDFKRVANGQLWYEESLPAESILSGMVWCDDPKNRVPGVTKQEVIDLLQDGVVQMGGKATTGKGQVQLRFQRIAGTAQDEIGETGGQA
jgi:CRISPR-associated protein Cmr4